MPSGSSSHSSSKPTSKQSQEEKKDKSNLTLDNRSHCCSLLWVATVTTMMLSLQNNKTTEFNTTQHYTIQHANNVSNSFLPLISRIMFDGGGWWIVVCWGEMVGQGVSFICWLFPRTQLIISFVQLPTHSSLPFFESSHSLIIHPSPHPSIHSFIYHTSSQPFNCPFILSPISSSIVCLSEP